MTDATVPRARGWWYDVEWVRCPRCRGSGERVECYDDLCHAQGRCMHDSTNNVCNLCEGQGEISDELDRRWHSREAFEPVTKPDADLRARGQLHAVARERHGRVVDDDVEVATDGGVDRRCPRCGQEAPVVVDVNSIGTATPLARVGEVHKEVIFQGVGRSWRLYCHSTEADSA